MADLFEDKVSLMDEYQLETENRIKNLLWTVSGDYSLQIKPNYEEYKRSKYIAFYDAIKQGAFAKFFDKDALSLYIIKKVFLTGDEDYLIYISQMCLDAAIKNSITSDRWGVPHIRKNAFEDMLTLYLDKMDSSFLGKVKIAMIQRELGYNYHPIKQAAEVLERIVALYDNADTMEIIRTTDWIYNNYIDKDFEKKHGTLDEVLAVTIEELAEYNWRDFLKDEANEDLLEKYIEDVQDSLTDMTMTLEEKREEYKANATVLKLYSPEKEEKIFSYIEQNFGLSYLTANEQKRREYKLCKDVHADCKLYFTHGVTRSPAGVNFRYKYAERLIENNKMEYYDKHRVIKKNIAVLAGTLKRSMIFRNQPEEVLAETGKIVPSRLWRIGRTQDEKVFLKNLKKDNSEFAVEILMDASGSQSKRAESVAIQGYIISAALSEAGIPHRVEGYCSFWNYTVLHCYRDFDDDKASDFRVLEYSATGTNRDGLAFRVAADNLISREEDNKILIVLSDGKPNDNTIQKEGVKTARPYIGQKSVKDSAFEIRRIRGMDISVLGVFTGLEEDLRAEQKIFGKDFAYIRNIKNFSNVVSTYLKKQIIDM